MLVIVGGYVQLEQLCCTHVRLRTVDAFVLRRCYLSLVAVCIWQVGHTQVGTNVHR